MYTLPPNQAASIESQRKINARRGQRPEYRDVAQLILRKTCALCGMRRRKYPRDSAGFFFQQAVDAPFDYSGPPVALAVTSPPFMDIVNYKRDNWMRCWFVGIDPDAIRITQTRKLAEWKELVRGVLESVAAIACPGSVFAFEVGEIHRGSLLLDRVVAEVAQETTWKPVCVVINEQTFTKTSNMWGR